MSVTHTQPTVGRRAFMKQGSLYLTTATFAPGALRASNVKSDHLRVGLITDLHYADKAPAGTRHYRETLGKLNEAAQQFQKDQATVLVELGDLIDAADSVSVEQGYLKTINEQFAAICKDRHYVLGNHCVDTLHKEEFLGTVGQDASYYSFERGAYHFVVLDSCFRSDDKPYGRRNFKWTDANVPKAELDWLAEDLQNTDKHVIVLAHQRLDVSNNHGVRNNPVVRSILEQSGRVLAVFQGHSHANDLKQINGIHYCTLVAMVEGSGPHNNGYSLLELASDGMIKVTGWRKQSSYDWPA